MAFDTRDDEHLIDLVCKHPPLYDVTVKQYKNIVEKEKIWEEIAWNMKRTSADCRKRWKCLRDSYSRAKRKRSERISTGLSLPHRSTKWLPFEKLQFLDATLERNRTCVKVENVDEDETSRIGLGWPVGQEGEPWTREVGKDELSGHRTRSKRRKTDKVEPDNLQSMLVQYWDERDTQDGVQRLRTQDEVDVDGINSFCAHIASVLSKLNPALRVDAKRKVFNLLTEYEIKNLQPPSSSLPYNIFFENHSHPSSTSR